MIIAGAGAQPKIRWDGGFGTIALSEITAAMNLPIVPPTGDEVIGTPTVPGSVGGWGTAEMFFEASFNNGQTWRPMSDAGGIVRFQFGFIEAKNFSSSSCLIRANIDVPVPTGIGLLLEIKPRGQ